MRYNTHLPREEDIYFRRMLIVPGHPEEIGIPIGIEIPHKHQISSISSMTSLDILRSPLRQISPIRGVLTLTGVVVFLSR